MTTTVEAPAAAPRMLIVRLAGALIAGGGQLTDAAALAIANSAENRRAKLRMHEAMTVLQADDLIVHRDDIWYAPNLGDLAAWLADAIEAREDAGLPVGPAIPHARAAA